MRGGGFATMIVAGRGARRPPTHRRRGAGGSFPGVEQSSVQASRVARQGRLGHGARVQERETDPRDAHIKRLTSKIGQMTMEAELREEKIARVEDGRSLAMRRSKK